MAATAGTAVSTRTRLAIFTLTGAAVAIGLGVYGRIHDPTGEALVSLFFTGSINLKVWLATTAFSLAAFQYISGWKMIGKLGNGFGPHWLGRAHRASGTLAFLCTIPVAYHCLWSLGFQTDSARVLAHGLLGCFFFGAFATKVLVVRTERMPGWALPVVGGALFTALTGLWLTSSVWFFTTMEFPGI